MREIVIQALGFLGIAASIITFQCKKHDKILLFKTVNELLFAIQYILLGAYTGTAMNIIGSIRNIISAKLVKKGKRTTAICIFFSVLFLVFTALTWDGYKSLLVVVAKVLSTVAYGNKNPKVVRRIILFTSLCWFAYSIFIGSYSGAINEFLTICSIIVGIIRIEIIPKRKSKTV